MLKLNHLELLTDIKNVTLQFDCQVLTSFTFYPRIEPRYAKANMAKDGASDHEVARMTSENLSEFMAKEQKVEMAVEECEKLIEAFEPTTDRTALTMEGKTDNFILINILKPL